MSEKDTLVQSIIAAAVASAGPRGSEGAWKAKINAAIPAIAAMMNDGTRQWKSALEVLDAGIFTAIYRGYTLEESSQRCLVTLETTPTKRYPDGLEPIRTHRTDNAAGKRMRIDLDQLNDGDQIVVWKSMETSAHDEDVKVRILVHFETRPTFTPTGAAAPRSEGSVPGRSNPPSAPAETSRPEQSAPARAGGQADSIVTERFDSLPSKVKAAVVRRARAEGITIPVPQDDRIDEFIQLMIEEEQ